MTNSNTDNRTPAQKARDALTIYDVRGLSKDETTEALANIDRIHAARFKHEALAARRAARKATP